MANKPVPAISVNRLYYALVVSDTEEGVTYSAPVWLQGVNTVAYNPNTQTATFDADGGTYDSFSADGEIQTTITIADLNPSDYATLLGVNQDSSTGLITETTEDNPPEVAIGFMSEMSNGAMRFVWILKGKFSKQEESVTSKGGSGITYQPRTIMHTAIPRTFDGAKRRILDSNDPLNSLTISQLQSATNGWFSSPDFDPANYQGTTTPVSTLVASDGAGAGEITLAWTAASGASNVAIQVSQGSDWVTVQNADAGASTATITGLTAGSEYLVRLYVTGGTNAGISNISGAKAGAGG